MKVYLVKIENSNSGIFCSLKYWVEIIGEQVN